MVVEAQAAARRGRQEQIAPEHLVLGLLTEPTALAATTLTALGVDLDVLRERIEAALVASDAEPGEQIPFSGPAKKVLELVFREALRLGHNYVGTEHLLLGLLADEESPAAQLHRRSTHAAAEEHIIVGRWRRCSPPGRRATRGRVITARPTFAGCRPRKRQSRLRPAGRRTPRRARGRA